MYRIPIYTKDPRFGSTRSFRERTNKKTRNGAYKLLDPKVPKIDNSNKKNNNKNNQNH